MQSTRTKAHATAVRQLSFPSRGGRRRGAGRKPNGAQAGVSHSKRPALAARFPVLVTMKLRAGLPSMRSRATLQQLHDALRGGRDRFGMRLVHFSIQSSHFHLLLEARDALSLSRGVQGLAVRIARALNRHWNRHGRVFADRFHSRILRTPREVRYALGYVLNNARKHGIHVGEIDTCSSGAAFDGWKKRARVARRVVLEARPPMRGARTWLLSVGWRRHGLIGMRENPASAP